MRLTRFLPVAVSVLFLSTLAAHADPTTTLNLNGTYVWNSQDYTTTGTVTFNPDTGTLLDANLSFGNWEGGSTTGFLSGFSLLNGATYPVDINEAWNLNLNQYEAPVIDLLLPVNSLVGYSGGSLCTLANQCQGESSTFFALNQAGSFTDGTLSLPGTLSPTPEPSSVTLLVAGALAMVGLIGVKRLSVRRLA
jgi:hypothetical protein